jgi:hypothetical protein
MAYTRTVTPVTIELLKQANRRAYEARRLTREERLARALAKGPRLLAEARLAAKLS